MQLNLADKNLPTESRQQHHEPHHGRPKSRTKTLQNRSKMCRILSPNRSGTVRVAKIALGRLLVRCFGHQMCARAAPRAVLGCPGVVIITWKMFLGAPKTFKNAPCELLRRAWSPFVLASVAQNARGLILKVLAMKFQRFFGTLVRRFSIAFCDRFLIAFQSLFRSMSWSHGPNPISAEP